MYRVRRQPPSGIVVETTLAMQNINQATAQSPGCTQQAEKAVQDLNDLDRVWPR